MKVDVKEQANFYTEDHIKSSNPHHETVFSSRFKPPWISKIFDTFGLISIATGIVAFFYSFTDLENGWQPFLFISLLFSGLIYVAIAVILRAVCESAFSTRELMRIKQIEHYK